MILHVRGTLVTFSCLSVGLVKRYLSKMKVPSYFVFCHAAGPWQPNSPVLPVFNPSLQVSIPLLRKQIVNHAYTLVALSSLDLHPFSTP